MKLSECKNRKMKMKGMKWMRRKGGIDALDMTKEDSACK